ncbi:UbiA-like polyprenyltransferase [Propionispora hippei]|uniref:4-hydroxybenzoate polyprenyltransferase n=1 Tax=Propionispora hippei DSM 15287 TaxID=1123003 RepID=A0A1M6A4E6_9FIRM|nr:UbiA-like polyprenyltransferase [Propionispora hippei]SHI31382.1 4-hydroxybenzoate polyprenyltransferase [Propionispora hippei DSM 15287]
MNKLKAHLENIALSHSVFALPFAYMGAILAVQGIPAMGDLFWITLAMVGARSAAMGLNALIDLKYDRLHPRFTKRPMVTGAVTPGEVVLLIAASLGVFVLAAAHLQPVCVKLVPLAVIPLAVYPYMKRVSWTCHLVLGLALSIAPTGAWIAITGSLAWPAVYLGLAVGIWIAGFDVIYGCQDVAFDKQHGLHSMPVRFGIPGALTLSRYMHAFSIGCFGLVGYQLQLGAIYFGGVILAALVLIYQHRLVSDGDFSRVTQAYFMRNGLVGIFILLFTMLNFLL